MNVEILQEVVSEILRKTPNKPFLCLPLSAHLYAILKDNHSADPKLVTGDLFYKGDYIFKQDFPIAQAKDGIFQDWSGHSWVEVEGLICDLSIFRTIYSNNFIKPFKQEILHSFGEGRGCLIAANGAMKDLGLSYIKVDYLSDEMATGIIKGFDPLLNIL